jgi:beta-glucanase (GH16 family)
MRRDAGVGISHALVLWPSNQVWPPEVDFSEDNATDQKTNYATLHYGTAGSPLDVSSHLAVDLTQWHTWGVEWTPGSIVYTLDGKTWASMVNAGVPSSPMKLCLQTQSWAPGVDGWEGVTGALTPPVVNMYVDWAVVYAYAPA